MRTLFGLILCLGVVSATNANDDWQDLFDGKTLQGWEQKNGTATYRVEDGAIVGRTAEGSPNSFLATKEKYGDFELEYETRVHPDLNSGVQIRSKTRDKTAGKHRNMQAGRVFGPQVESESSKQQGGESGYIYGEATGRGWVTPKDALIPHKHVNDGEWNHFRVRAVGPHIETWVNGNKVSDLTDHEIYKEHPTGFIGLQVHGIKKGTGPYEASWRNIKIRELHGAPKDGS